MRSEVATSWDISHVVNRQRIQFNDFREVNEFNFFSGRSGGTGFRDNLTSDFEIVGIHSRGNRQSEFLATKVAKVSSRGPRLREPTVFDII